MEKDNVLKNVRIPLGGDLLGRERVTGAKKTRMGCDMDTDRFESIIDTPALWHSKQAFLKVNVVGKINYIFIRKFFVESIDYY
jgi:hypothetical protein